MQSHSMKNPICKLAICLVLGTTIALTGCMEDKVADSGSNFTGTTWSGSLTGDQTGTWTFTVAANASISGTVDTPSGTFTLSGGLTPAGDLTGTQAENADGYAQIYGAISGDSFSGTWQGSWGVPTLNQSSNGPFTGGKSTAASANAACEWDPSSFYNEQQVASYQGVTYTAINWVTPFGAAGAAIFNPASDKSNWTKGGKCGITPYIRVTEASCTRGASADVVVLKGTAVSGGVGDAIAAYTNLTDASFSVENNFGLPNTSYSMSCDGAGWTSTQFSSATTPVYSVCIKTEANDVETHWSSTQTIPHSSTLIVMDTAYASKGHPLHATVFNIGAIVLGLDAVRSEGFSPITGNCN